MASRKLYTTRNESCTVSAVERFNVTLDDEYAERLMRLAERVHVQPGTLARSLLSTAIDEADPDPRDIAAILDGIPGHAEDLERAREQVRIGQTISLDDL
jgi:hypothetical protein